MEPQEIQSLLTQVKTLNSHYAKLNELTGDNFNVFKILKLESSEVRLHSAFLAELLNPKGAHGQKDVFLRLFIKAICSEDKPFDAQSGKVKIEKHTGNITADGTEGGRIDIIITDKYGKHIIIENKIYAEDQTNQLLRYYNHSPSAELIYLTLDGKAPSKESHGGLEVGRHFKCLSYRSDLLQWLEQCRKEVVVYPGIRESITQYINLIKYLTNQTLNTNMKIELSQLLRSHLESSFIISDNLHLAKNQVLNDFIGQTKKFSIDNGLWFSSNINLEKNFTGIYIGKADWKYVSIGFQFQNRNKGLTYGIICKNNPIENPIKSELKEKISAIGLNSRPLNGWWPWYNEVEEPYGDWSKYEAWESMVNGQMFKYVQEMINYLLLHTKDIKL